MKGRETDDVRHQKSGKPAGNRRKPSVKETNARTANSNANGKQPTASGRPKKQRPRRASSRLSAFLDDQALRQAEKIALGFQFRTSGIGLRTQSFSGQQGGEQLQEHWQLDLMRAFTDWAETLKPEGLSLAATLDILVFGKSCRQVDRGRRKRNGFAKANLIACLEQYGKLFG